jgi:hypothetical protein
MAERIPNVRALITGGTHHAALGRWRADNHRLAAQLRVIALFHGRIKRIHIEMKHDSEHSGDRLSRPVKRLKSHEIHTVVHDLEMI